MNDDIASLQAAHAAALSIANDEERGSTERIDARSEANSLASRILDLQGR